MHRSFLVLCISSTLLAINEILRAIADIHGFFGLYPLDRYVMAICHTAFYFSLLSFCRHAYAVIGKHRWSPAESETDKLRRTPEEVIGIAISSTLSIFFLSAMAKQQFNIANVATIYVLFLLTSAMLLQPSSKGWSGNLTNAMWPAMFFLLSALIQIFWPIMFVARIYANQQSIGMDRQLALLIIGARTCLTLLAIPAIMAISLARQVTIGGILSLSAMKSTKQHEISKAISWPIAALALVATALMTAQASNR